jgi:hypothetical protein
VASQYDLFGPDEDPSDPTRLSTLYVLAEGQADPGCPGGRPVGLLQQTVKRVRFRGHSHPARRGAVGQVEVTLACYGGVGVTLLASPAAARALAERVLAELGGRT